MKWILGFLCLFFLVLIHEFGHFLAAKICGVKVESFSIGFGPILLHKTFKGTDWRLSLFPLGGYCGMKGEKEFAKAIETNTPLQAESDSLYGVHPLKRALTGFAGPFFNYILAVLSYTIISMTGYTYYTYSNKITLADEIYPELHSAARDAGICSGDEIIAINGKKIEDFSDILSKISSSPDEDLEIEVLRDGISYKFMAHTDFDKETGTGKLGVSADVNSRIEKEAVRYSFFPAIYHGFKDSFNTIALTFKGISILFKGVKVQNAISGPARTTDILGSTIKQGFSEGLKTGIVSILELLAIISISLFIMNLLPIPILDGGLILFAIIEAIFKKKIPPKIQYYIQFVGIFFIAALFALGLFGDISYFLGKKV